MKTSTKWLLLVLLIVVVVGLGFFIWMSLNQKKVVTTNFAPTPITNSSIAQTSIPIGDYNIVVKENADKSKSDIYLKDSETNKELFFTTVDSSDKTIEGNWLGGAYINGNIYVYVVSGDKGEIWQYSRTNTTGTKLFSDQKGLSFSVSPDEKYIVAIPNINDGDKTGKIVLLDKTGKELKIFTANVTGISIATANLEVNNWKTNNVWLAKAEATQVTGLIKIDLVALTLKEYAFKAPGHKFMINESGTFVVWSSYPFLFDVDTAKEFETNKTKVTLNLYDLSTGTNKVVATAGGKNFSFEWMDDNNFTYIDPTSGQTVKKSIN